MALLLSTAADPGSASWADSSTLAPTLKTFVFAPSGVADATNNIFTTTASLRTAVNAAAGPKQILITEDSTFDAGTYGDDETWLIGARSTSFTSGFPGARGPTLTVEEGAIIPASVYRGVNIRFEGSSAVSTTRFITFEDTIINLVNFGGSSEYFAPSGTFGFTLKNSALEPGFASAVIDTGNNDGSFDLFVSRVSSGALSGTGGTITVRVFDDFSGLAGQIVFSGTLSLTQQEGVGVSAFSTRFALSTSTALPSIDDVPAGQIRSFVNVSGGGGPVDITPDGADLINGVNAAYTLTANYDGVILMKVETGPGGNPEWVTVAETN